MARRPLCPSALRRFAAIVILLIAAPAGAGDEPIVTSDLLRIRTVTSIDVSRDGARAVFAVRSIAEKAAREGSNEAPEEVEGRGPAYEYRSHLFLLDIGAQSTAAPRQITFGDRSDDEPAISPDGAFVAFVRDSEEENEEGEKTSQVWVLDLRGGEARQVTSLEHGASGPQWSPDSRQILVHSSIPIDELPGTPPWPMERPRRDWKDDAGGAAGEARADEGAAAITPRPDGTREEIRAWLGRNAAAHDPFVINRIDFQDELSLRRTMRFTQLFLVDPRDSQAPPRQLTSDFYDHEDGRFAGVGGSIVYVSRKPAREHIDRVLQHNLRMMDRDGGNDRLILSREGWSFSSPRASLDGSMLAFRGDELDEPAFRQSRLGIVSLNGQSGAAPEPVWLTEPATFDASVDSIGWLPARSAILFTSARRGGFPLMTCSAGLLEPAPVVDEMNGQPVGVHAFGAGGATIVYTVCSPSNPCTLWVSDARGPRLVHDLNPWVERKRLVLPRADSISRPDGVRVDCWIMEPAGRESGTKYPLCLEMHGGPSAMWGPGELTMWHEFQLLCSFGYGVVYSNPRGSGGYGYAFQKANFQNWGEGPAGDVLAVVDQVLVEEDWIDPERLVLTGGSYAGYLTAWIVGHDHRFKAAVAQRGVYELETFFGEGNAWQLVEWAMGGLPWDGRIRPILERESPFTYVSRIRTPLLITHASQDLRTGVSQSEMLYRALKQLGREVEYVRYPGAGHDLSRTGDPRQRMDRLNRIIEFFDRYAAPARPAPLAD